MHINKRNPAADIIRCLAFFFVVSVHFFLQNGFYKATVQGERMLVMCCMRALFIICVPLFITLSGYLLTNKKPCKQYYTRITKILLTYLLAGILCMVCSVWLMGQTLSFPDALKKLLNFTAAPYGWYIEMYLGLFLLIPFLNILYQNIPTQKWKQGFVFTLVIITSFPSVINAYGIQIVPDWWTDFYPLTYYFLGSYIREYGIAIKKGWNLLLIALCVGGFGYYTYWRSYNTTFVVGDWCQYESLFQVILTLLVFVFFINRNYNRMPQKLSAIFGKLSGLCLGGYLVSSIFDLLFYPILLEKVPTVPHRLEYYIIIVPVVFVCSLVTSYGIQKLQWILEWTYEKLTKRIRKQSF